jgi:hypothetical protein|nr:hypothetical protein [uncultured Bacteroides sp.]
MKIKLIIISISLIIINNLAWPQDYVPIRILTFDERMVFKMNTNDTISCIAKMICTFDVKNGTPSITKTTFFSAETRDTSDVILSNVSENLKKVSSAKRIAFLLDSIVRVNKENIKFSYDTLSIKDYENRQIRMWMFLPFKIVPQ